MENTNQFLGTERVGKLMRRYAVPCIISLLVGALYNIVDQIFIANASYLGSYGNAANTVVFPLTVVALAIAVMIGDGWQQYQARTSIGSGQLTGKGLFNGPRVETNLVTFQHSDFIFSVAGEELGFIGCTAIIVLLLLYLLRVLYIASKARDDLGRCMCFGFFGLIALQSVSNIGMCLALLPVMGVTLPFFSAGGSSAVCLYLGFGLIQSVYMHRPDANVPHLRSTRTLKMNFRKLNA